MAVLHKRRNAEMPITKAQGGCIIKLSRKIYPAELVWSAVSELLQTKREVFLDGDEKNWKIWVGGSCKDAMGVATHIFSKGMSEGLIERGT